SLLGCRLPVHEADKLHRERPRAGPALPGAVRSLLARAQVFFAAVRAVIRNYAFISHLGRSHGPALTPRPPPRASSQRRLVGARDPRRERLVVGAFVAVP